jgi:hypothetical protein
VAQAGEKTREPSCRGAKKHPRPPPSLTASHEMTLGTSTREDAAYSALIFAARITFAHFGMSVSMRAANSSGVLTIAVSAKIALKPAFWRFVGF